MKVKIKILIIDDGSTDNTKCIISSNQEIFNYNVIFLSENFGYGHAIKCGFKYAINNEYDIMITFDMDGQHESKFLIKFIKQILFSQNNIDILSGTRYLSNDFFYKNPWKDRFLVNTIISAVLNDCGYYMTDSFCGYKAYRVKAMESIKLSLNGYEMPIELWMKAKINHLKVKELAIPVIYKNRDLILKKRTCKSFLFHEGEKRIEKYIKIISDHNNNMYNRIIPELKTLFRKNYSSIEHISSSNFKQIQKKIFLDVSNILSNNICQHYQKCLENVNIYCNQHMTSTQICGCKY